MKKLLFLLIFPVTILFIGCSLNQPSPSCDNASGNVCPLPTITGQQTSVTGVVDQVIQTLKDMDFGALATLAGKDGIRFSPYEHVNPTTDIVLSKQLITNALSLSRSFHRGTYDGSGEPMDLGIGQYREKFVYDVDFASAPEVYRNQPFTRGNIISNVFDVYSGKQIVEFHFAGFDKQYAGMDRKSLYIILDKENGAWKVIGIVHGQRTT